jgi:dienelactone hydrolase
VKTGSGLGRFRILAPLLLVGLIAGGLSGCSGLSGEGDLQLTWSGARVAMPGQQGTATLRGLNFRQTLPAGAQPRRYPVILYLHGCTGMGRMEKEFGESLAARGFVFIAPDSMARRYRPLQCDPKRQTGGKNLFVFDFRMAEISYALNQLRNEAWVDWNNLFLMGGSEGGVAAALYRGDEFRARVIFQWTCHGAALVRGMAGPGQAPVLAIVNRGDPWYQPDKTAQQSGDCGKFIESRPGSSSLVLQRQGVHSVLDLASVRRAIQEFLAQNLSGSGAVGER